MSDIIRRVSDAIEKTDEDWSSGKFHPKLQFQDYAMWLDTIARAAIEAMRELPEEPGPRYTAGEYSRRTQEAMVDDALGHPRSP